MKNKKIHSILQYNLSSYETNCLKECEIINGCGGKGGVDFDIIVIEAIQQIKGYDHKELEELWENFTKICNEHDLEFRLQVGFTKANFRMGKKVYKLCKDWAGKKEAFILGATIFLLLQKYGKSFYKNAKPLEIN